MKRPSLKELTENWSKASLALANGQDQLKEARRSETHATNLVSELDKAEKAAWLELEKARTNPDRDE